ncbi:hypothetical protein TrVGV298_011686 [Trichoderma virens]|nr:hypothetical protein TrVGV298_011686 [Trichoderma virens]
MWKERGSREPRYFAFAYQTAAVRGLAQNLGMEGALTSRYMHYYKYVPCMYATDRTCSRSSIVAPTDNVPCTVYRRGWYKYEYICKTRNMKGTGYGVYVGTIFASTMAALGQGSRRYSIRCFKRDPVRIQVQPNIGYFVLAQAHALDGQWWKPREALPRDEAPLPSHLKMVQVQRPETRHAACWSGLPGLRMRSRIQ